MDYIRKKSSFFFPLLFSSLHVFISSFLQIMMIPPRFQVMKIFWKTWTKMTFWFFKWLAMMASNTNNLFNSHEMEEGGGGQYVNPTIGVLNVLGTMWATLTIFKTLTNFTLEEFDKFVSWMVSTIRAHAKSIGELFISYFMFSILIFGA
jgi:hypothetical protein